MRGAYPLNEWQSKVHDIKRKYAYDAAETTITALGTMANVVAAAFGAVAATSATVKGMERATEKVMDFGKGGYGGDWWLIKDLARCTIAVDDDMTGWKVFHAIRDKYFVASNGWGFAEWKPKPEAPSGYSDWKVIVRRQGSLAEIQINTKNLLYAKDLPFFRKVCPADEAMMKARYFVPGGLGHKLYEISRSHGPRADAADAAGILYYDYFRNPDVRKGWKARDAVFGLGVNLADAG
jgi:hypothetical protein